MIRMTMVAGGATLLLSSLAAPRPAPEPAHPQESAASSATVAAAVPGIAHVEIPADDPTRASAFYRTLFGWSFEPWEGPLEYWSTETGPADRRVSAGLIRRAEPVVTPIFTVYVPSVDQVLERLEASGGRLAAAKTAVPGVGWQAYLIDSEQNPFAIFELDPSAR